MRKASEINDFDDEDYSEDEDIDFENENQQHVQISPPPPPPPLPSTFRSVIINSITSNTSITANDMTRTTEFSETNKTSNDKSKMLSLSTRLKPTFICLLFSFSFLYRYIHVNNFLF